MSEPTRGDGPCRNGHLYDRSPSGTCRPCANAARARGRGARRAEAAKLRVKPPARKCGHPWTDRMRTKPDCNTCNQNRARAYEDRKRGGPPRKPDPEKFPCGHSRADARRGNQNSCGTCHREKQKARYRADPETHRNKAKAYQKANRDKANARTRRFYEQHPGYDARRSYAPDAETREWLTIIAGDPCAYCGAPSGAVDHILAASQGGAHHWSNFTATCRACNSSKRDRPLLAWMLSRRAAAT